MDHCIGHDDKGDNSVEEVEGRRFMNVVIVVIVVVVVVVVDDVDVDVVRGKCLDMRVELLVVTLVIRH